MAGCRLGNMDVEVVWNRGLYKDALRAGTRLLGSDRETKRGVSPAVRKVFKQKSSNV